MLAGYQLSVIHLKQKRQHLEVPLARANSHSITIDHVLYANIITLKAHHYNLQFVYFKPTFWKLKNVSSWSFFQKILHLWAIIQERFMMARLQYLVMKFLALSRFTKLEIYIVGIQFYNSGSATLGSPQKQRKQKWKDLEKKTKSSFRW
jgi:hypothetical protein